MSCMTELDVFADQTEPGVAKNGRVTRKIWLERILRIEEFIGVNPESDAPPGYPIPEDICVVVFPGGMGEVAVLVNHTPEGVIARMAKGEAGY